MLESFKSCNDAWRVDFGPVGGVAKSVTGENAVTQLAAIRERVKIQVAMVQMSTK